MLSSGSMNIVCRNVVCRLTELPTLAPSSRSLDSASSREIEGSVPVTTRWIFSCFVTALLVLLLSGWRYRGKEYAAVSVGVGSLAGFCSGLAQTGGPPIVGYWLGRPIPSVIARANIMLYFGFSGIFSAVSYTVTGLINADAIKFALVVGPVYAIGIWFGASLFGKASESVFRAICYALIAAAVIIGLPALDGVLRSR